MLVTMHLDLATLVVIAANVLGAAMAMPQARKILRDRHATGVSPAWAAISAALNAWWGAYGIGVGDLSIVPVAAVSTAAYLVIAAAIIRYHTGRRVRVVASMAATSAAAAGLPLLAVALGGWTAGGLVLGAMYGIQLSPAVVTVYRSADVSGVSVATWAIALVEAALWGVYGLPRGDVGLVALAVTGVFMSTLVLLRLFVRRPRRTGRPATVGYRLAPA